MAAAKDSDLAAHLSAAVQNPYANRCSVGHLLSSLSVSDRAAVQDALHKINESLRAQTSMATGYTARWLSRLLAEHGYKVSDRMIRRHLHKDCSCDA